MSTLSRRDMLKCTGLGLGALAFVPLGRGELRAAPMANLKRTVFLNLRGGNDGLNTVVPVTLTSYFDQRPSLALNPSACLTLENGPGGVTAYRLHPALVNTQQLWNEGSVAVINGVGYPSANLSHFVSEDIWSLGLRNASPGSGSGWIARYADLYTTSSMEIVSVGMGTRRDFLGGSSSPFIVDRLSSFEFDTDWRYSRNHALRLQKIRDMLAIDPATGLRADIRSAADQAHQLVDQVQQAQDDYTSTVSYSNDRESQRLRDIAVLVQGGFETKVFYTGTGGYDTHSGQAGRHQTLLTRLDAAIGSFAQDCKDTGVWNDMALVVISEFGRRNFENGSAGTDHGKANTLFVIGGAVNGGLYGPTHTESELLNSNVDYQIDFRTVYSQILQNHLGVDPTPVFTETQEFTTSPGAFI